MESALSRHADVAKTPQWQQKDKLSQKCGPHATVYLINGDRYIGDWKHNKRHGKGMHFYKRTGNLYEGEWESDKRQGYGTLSVPIHNTTQAGGDVTGVNHGDDSGVMSPDRFAGNSRVKAGMGAANSVAVNTDTVMDISLSKDSLFTKSSMASMDGKTTGGNGNGNGGNGVASTAKGHDMALDELRKVYAGQWRNDKRHGIGTYFYRDGSIYEGRWENDMKEGWGRMAYADNSVYEGEWHHQKRHGQGILLLANGDRYEGMWLNDDKEGPGKFVYRTKRQTYEGEWAKGLPKCGTLRDLPPLPGQRHKLYMIPPLALSDPSTVLETQRQLIYDERVHRMMGVHDDAQNDTES